MAALCDPVFPSRGDRLPPTEPEEGASKGVTSQGRSLLLGGAATGWSLYAQGHSGWGHPGRGEGAQLKGQGSAVSQAPGVGGLPRSRRPRAGQGHGLQAGSVWGGLDASSALCAASRAHPKKLGDGGPE